MSKINKLIDVIQYGYNLYGRYDSGKISRLRHKIYGYSLKENVLLFDNRNFTIDDKEYIDIFNRKVKKIFINKFYGFTQENKDELFGNDLNYLYYMKEHNLEYSNEVKDYRIWYWDIEVLIGKESNDNSPENPRQPITTISWYDTINNKYYIIGWHEKETKNIEKYKYEEKVIDNKTVVYIYVKNEIQLLKMFLSLLRKYKPIMIIGWFSNFFDMPYLVKRMEINNISTNLLSPINANIKMFQTQNNREWKIIIPGLYSIELNRIIDRYIYEKFPSMSLNNVSKQLGLGKKIDIDLDLDYRNNFYKFMEYNIQDVNLTKMIDERFNITNFMVYLHYLTYIPFDQILSTSLIVKNAIIKTSENVVIDRKLSFNNYQGAIVLNPKYQGTIKNICTLDANSMYPTSIITFNISPDTYITSIDEIEQNKENITEFVTQKLSKRVNKNLELIKINDINITPVDYIYQTLKENNVDYVTTGYSNELNEHGYIFMHHNYKVGIYTKYLKIVYDKRVEIKNKMKVYNKNSNTYKKYNAIQQALKLILNSTYGANGYSQFFLYDPRIAETITYFARKLLVFGMDVLKKKDYEIQYGDSVGKDSEIVIKDKNGNIKFIKIKDLFDENKKYIIGNKEYNDVNDIYTPSLNVETKKQEWKPIKYIMRHKIDSKKKKMYRIYITLEDYIDVTEDHSIMVKVKNKIIPMKPQELLNYNNRKSLISLEGFDIDDNFKGNEKAIKLWEYIGFFIGDGYSYLNIKYNKRYVNVMAAGLDMDEFEDVMYKKLVEYNIVSSYRRYSKYTFGDKGKIVKIIDDVIYKHKSKKQKIDWILKLPLIYQRAILRGYFSADGYIEKVGNSIHIELTSIDLENLKVIRKSLLLNNIESTIIYRNNSKCKKTYDLYIKAKDNYKFMKNIGFIFKRKNILCYDRKPITYNKLLKIEEIDYNDYVYDIEVKDNHTFFGNNILVHNTDSFFVILKEKNDDYEKCVSEGNILNNMINNNIYKHHTLKYMSSNLPEIYKKYLGFKLEHVLHYIYFGDSKKRYFGIEYPDESGEEHSYVRGMNIIRKDAPKAIKQILNTLIYKLIKENITKNDFNEIETILKKMKLEDIGIVKSFNKRFKDYKVLPQHVRAAKFANELFKVKISNFDKPYMFYIKLKNVNKKYKYYNGVIALNQKDLNLLKNSDIIEIDYNKLIEKQILDQLKEFKYVKNLENIINVLKYKTKHSQYVELFDF